MESFPSYVTSWCRPKKWLSCSTSPKQCMLVLVCLVAIYIFVKLLPPPVWICGSGEQELSPALSYQKKIMLDHMLQSRLEEERENSSKAIADNLDPGLLHMYPIYLSEQRRGNETSADDFPLNVDNSLANDKPRRVKIFLLENLDFREFGRTWLNEVNLTEGKENWVVHHIEKYGMAYPLLQELPDCVRMRVSEEGTTTRICVHKPDVDNFISNRVRDTGTWEEEYLNEMKEYFKANPNSQLLDLGCNIGVFTLYAASLGIPVLAVDILPANLALIQLSIATTDALNDGLDLRRLDILDYMITTGKNQPRPHQRDMETSKVKVNQSLMSVDSRQIQDRAMLASSNSHVPYSDLITTVHNAVYSRRTQMVVYLKDDLNLGGTEVKEFNTNVTNAPGFQSRSLKSVNDVDEISEGRRKRLKNFNPLFKKDARMKLEKIKLGSDDAHTRRVKSKLAAVYKKPAHELPPVIPEKSFLSSAKVKIQQEIDTEEKIMEKKKKKDIKVLVDGICLDDLLPYLQPGKSVFLKMDVEGSEPEVLKCSSQFFYKADVRVVMMEFIFHKYTPAGQQIIKFLTHHNLVPAKDALGFVPLDTEEAWNWPENVFWVRAR